MSAKLPWQPNLPFVVLQNDVISNAFLVTFYLIFFNKIVCAHAPYMAAVAFQSTTNYDNF